MVDGPNTYGFCGGDPVNRSDPIGTEWVWNGTDWDWVPEPNRPNPPKDANGRIARPAPLVRNPEGSFGHHPVPQATTDKLLAEGRISDDAADYLKYSTESYQGWVPEARKLIGEDAVHGYGVAPGTDIQHSEYSSTVEERFRKYINTLPGKKAGVADAKRFMDDHIKATMRYSPNDIVSRFNNAWLRRKAQVSEQVSAIKQALTLRRAQEEALATERAAREARIAARRGISTGTKVTVVTAAVVILNTLGRKVYAENKTPGEASKEMVVETYEGIKGTPGMIASVPGEIAGTARDYEDAVRKAERERRDEAAFQYNHNFGNDNFRPFAGIEADARATFAPIEGAAKAAIDFGEGIKQEWFWWLP